MPESEPPAPLQIDPVRLQKLQALRDADNNPFAIERFPVTHQASQIARAYESFESQTVSLAGRLRTIRTMGKAAFMDLVDSSGRIQLYVRRDDVGEDVFEDIRRHVDPGDIAGVTGYVFKTKTGEISIHVQQWALLAKALRNLPFGKEYETDAGEEHHAGTLADHEIRYRQRYVDLIVNKDAREKLLNRTRIVRAMREYLDNDGYVEVETPMLQAVAGGAAARPFHTHHNALDMDLHLRISLELYLKRLIVGGIDRVYEIGRVFRNEGVSTRHSPEFTLMELYAAYADLEDMMSLVEGLFRRICTVLHGVDRFTFQGNTIDLNAPFARLPMLEGIRINAGVEPAELVTLESAHAVMRRLGLPTESEHTVGGIIEKLHERFTQPTLIQPTFITDFPLESSPLAKKSLQDPTLARRFEVYLGCAELGNAFSEINDPLDQRERFTSQVSLRAGGDAEAHPMDEDYLRALEYGMPPTGGFGVGVDRLALVMTDAATLRDVILFPLLRHERM